MAQVAPQRFAHSGELYDAGYAVRSYDIVKDIFIYRFRGETFEEPVHGSCLIGEDVVLHGWGLTVYPIEALRRASERRVLRDNNKSHEENSKWPMTPTTPLNP